MPFGTPYACAAFLGLDLSPGAFASTQTPLFICRTKTLQIGVKNSSCLRSTITNNVSEGAPEVISETLPVSYKAFQNDWKCQLKRGSVLEVFNNSELRFTYVDSLYEKGVIARFVHIHDTVGISDKLTKVSFDEIISVWPHHLILNDQAALSHLVTAVSDGLLILSRSSPRALDAAPVYNSMRRTSNTESQAALTSFQISEILFPIKPDHTSQRRAALTVATSLLIASDKIRFKRAEPGCGWRALPPSVTISRGRCSFVDTCAAILDDKRTTADSSNSTSSSSRIVWSRDQLDILRDLEIVAASGCVAKGTAASTLQQLGYAPNDDGAANLLLDINYWSTGVTSHFDSLNDTSSRVEGVRPFNGNVNDTSEGVLIAQNDRNGNSLQRDERMEWTFSAEILAEARDIRSTTRARKRGYTMAKKAPFGKRRRSLLHPPEGQDVLRTYCIDEKSSRFLDDAISVRVLDGNLIRLWLHIADVDEIIKSGCALDEFAKERGQSLYLPLKPLHMLPAAAMDAASFSTSLPTEAITVMVDFDVNADSVKNWEVFPSIVPPVRKVNYEQFDVGMELGAKAAQLSDEELSDLKSIAFVAPLLVDKLDTRKSSRRMRRSRDDVSSNKNENSNGGNQVAEERTIASVRLVRRWDRNRAKGSSHVARIVDFQTSGSHQTVNDVLTCAGSLVRQFAKENRVHLPEDRDAFLHSGRCGTAPLRRYSDLAVQRQIKCILFGRQPAGKRRMDELKIWLGKRQSAAERTLAERRRMALFESFSNFCAQKCAITGEDKATVRGIVRSVCVTKRCVLKVDVSLVGTGLSATASVSDNTFEIIRDLMKSDEAGRGAKNDKSEAMLECARKVLRPNTKVRVEISEVNTVSFTIQANIVNIL